MGRTRLWRRRWRRCRRWRFVGRNRGGRWIRRKRLREDNHRGINNLPGSPFEVARFYSQGGAMQTYSVPPDATFLSIFTIGAGGGGGCGASGATGSNRGGGGSGSPGHVATV